MTKRPSLRVASIGDVDKGVLAELLADLETFASFLPFKIDDFEITGSAARGCWQFHSDLDVNLATGERWKECLELFKTDYDARLTALTFLHSVSSKWGIWIAVSMEVPTFKDIPQKQCYRLREGKWCNKVEGVAPRVDCNRVTKVWSVRPAKTGTYTFSSTDEEGIDHPNQDPYPKEEVEKWAKIYGDKFLRLGDTTDTSYLK